MTRQNRKLKFIQRSIEALPAQPPEAASSNYEVTDTVESGLKIAVYKSGKRCFRHRYTYMGVKMMLTLGEFPAVTIERARERVRVNKSLLAEDIDPREERQAKRDAIDFETFATKHFLPHAKQTMGSYKDVKSRIKVWLVPTFGDKKLAQINKQAVSKFHHNARNKSATTANRCKSLLSSMFRYAIEMGFATENPCHGVSKFKEMTSRKRVLSNDEMQRFVKALMEAMTTPQGKAAFLLLMCGKRKLELLAAQWSNVDWENQKIYIPKTKNGESGFAMLNSQAFALLKQMEQERDKNVDWIFPSKQSKRGHLTDIRRTFKTICTQAEIEGLTIHGMRRAYASTLINANIPLVQIKELLNHKDIRTTMVYAHLSNTSLQNANETAGKEMEKFMN